MGFPGALIVTGGEPSPKFHVQVIMLPELGTDISVKLIVLVSQEGAVKKYIAGQHEHHKNEDFKSELLRLLRAHEIEFDERYIFD